MLAEAASQILQANQNLHKGIGWLTSRALGFMGAGNAVSAFAGELAANLPLPTDAKVIAVARALQVSGVAICISRSADLTRCQCFSDLALGLAKTVFKKLLKSPTWATFSQQQ